MKRRNFVAASAMLGATGLPASSSILKKDVIEKKKELYELRSYEIPFGANKGALMAYLNNVLHPALWEIGCNHTYIFKEQGDAEPTKIWTLISYPNMETYLNSTSMESEESFINDAKEYTASGKTFDRYTSSLLMAFDGLPQLLVPGADKNLFELRFYEGENEDAVRRKISMFNVEEIDLFNKVGLPSVFFGDMRVGPYMPCLVYMLAFKDMDHRNKAWGDFVAHPEWNRMKALPKYANTVSNIRKLFLERV